MTWDDPLAPIDEDAEIELLRNILSLSTISGVISIWKDPDKIQRDILEEFPAKVAADTAYQNANNTDSRLRQPWPQI